MKFDKKEPKEIWTAKRTRDQILKVRAEVSEYHREMKQIDSDINVLKEKKKQIAYRMSNKDKYLHQLMNQLIDQVNM